MKTLALGRLLAMFIAEMCANIGVLVFRLLGKSLVH